MAGRIRLRSLRAVAKEAQGRKRARYGRLFGHPAIFDRDRIAGQREAGCRDAGRPVRRRLVGDQSVERVRLVFEIGERPALHVAQQLVSV